MAAIKICGITRLEDAQLCVDLGVEAIGLNFWPRSPRVCSEEAAERIARDVGHQARVVGVFVDATPAEIKRIRNATGVSWAQLHGDESPETLAELAPDALKALRLRTPEDVKEASRYPGELLIDAYVEGSPGGTGQTADWTLAQSLATERMIWLAGGLRPANVSQALDQVRPYGVDVASGVETRAGVKDPQKVRDFVQAVRAFSAREES